MANAGTLARFRAQNSVPPSGTAGTLASFRANSATSNSGTLASFRASSSLTTQVVPLQDVTLPATSGTWTQTGGITVTISGGSFRAPGLVNSPGWLGTFYDGTVYVSYSAPPAQAFRAATTQWRGMALFRAMGMAWRGYEAVKMYTDPGVPIVGTPRPANIPDVIDGRPTYLDLDGTAVVRYEDLYVSGDTVNAALGRLNTRAIVTFPEGIFGMDNFQQNLAYISIYIPKICAGIWGAKPMGVRHGRDYQSTSGTIFQINPNTSTWASYAASIQKPLAVPFRVLMRLGGTGGANYGNFHVRGTDQPGAGQGHNYFGFFEYSHTDFLNMQDVLISGCQIDGVSPPNETFGLGIHCHSSYPKVGHMVARVEVDGRRYSDGIRHGGLATIQNCDKGTWVDCYLHDARASSTVGYQSTHLDFFDCRSENNGTGPNPLNGQGWNYERADAIRMIRCSAGVDRSNGNTGVHITFSNDTWNSNGYGTLGDGSLYLEAPTWNAFPGLGDWLYVQTWHPYSNGDTQVTSPVAVNADGTPLALFKWVHSTDQQN